MERKTTFLVGNRGKIGGRVFRGRQGGAVRYRHGSHWCANT